MLWYMYNKSFGVYFRSLLNKTNDGELFTLDAIRSGIRFQRSVAEGWIKVRGQRRKVKSTLCATLFTSVVVLLKERTRRIVESFYIHKKLYG